MRPMRACASKKDQRLSGKHRNNRHPFMNKKFNSQKVGRFSLAVVFFLFGGGLAVLSYEAPVNKQAARTESKSRATLIQSLLEQSAVGKPHVAAVLRVISQSMPSFDNFGRMERMGGMT